MPVTSVDKDTENLTMTITTDLDAGVDRVWQMWADPRLLEKWWGPPTYPATFYEHGFEPGGVAKYYMTSPEGQKFGGIWDMTAIEEPSRIEFEDAFADDDGNINPKMPRTKIRVDITGLEGSGKTRMTITSNFASAEAMEQLISMGMDEGMKLAMGQIDDLL